MKPIFIDFYHKEFDSLSDRSVRQFMKNVGTAVKQAQLQEISDFVFSLDLEYAQQRSIQDCVKKETPIASAYYVETIKRGSLSAVFLVGASLLAVLARPKVISIIDDATERERYLKKLKKFLRVKWTPNLADEISDQLCERNLGSHIVVDEIAVKDKQSRMIIKVKLVTQEDNEGKVFHAETTPEFIYKSIDEQLAAMRQK